MTRTQFLDARRNVRREIVAYLSIVIIGMLASLSYLGIAYSAATLKKDALHYFNVFREGINEAYRSGLCQAWRRRSASGRSTPGFVSTKAIRTSAS